MARKKNSHNAHLQFNEATRLRVYKRDGAECLFCRLQYHMHCTDPMQLEIKDIMHYINKSAGGLGVEQNGVLGCRYHHGLLDNGNRGLRSEMLEIMRNYLKEQYSGWDEEDLYYSKWKGFLYQ
ncbi:MAG: hypothetical protein PHP50_10105 [Lachnospiraceae bacterium]|nr:hypothetical protein [Lachnospiraceae bacterium]